MQILDVSVIWDPFNWAIKNKSDLVDIAFATLFTNNGASSELRSPFEKYNPITELSVQSASPWDFKSRMMCWHKNIELPEVKLYRIWDQPAHHGKWVAHPRFQTAGGNIMMQHACKQRVINMLPDFHFFCFQLDSHKCSSTGTLQHVRKFYRTQSQTTQSPSKYKSNSNGFTCFNSYFPIKSSSQ